MVDFVQAPLVHDEAAGGDELRFGERLQELLIFLNFNVFSDTNLFIHISDRFAEAEDLDLDFDTVVDHNVELADFPDHIDYLNVQILIDHNFEQLEAFEVVSNNDAPQLVLRLVQRDEGVV